jgi:hypothetical protein
MKQYFIAGISLFLLMSCQAFGGEEDNRSQLLNTLTSISNPISGNKSSESKPWIFLFYANWCSSCQGNSRFLIEQLELDKKQRSAQLVLVNVDPILKIDKFKEQLKSGAVYSAHDKSGKIFHQLFRQKGVPYMAVVNNNKLLAKFPGHLGNSDIISIKKLITLRK